MKSSESQHRHPCGSKRILQLFGAITVGFNLLTLRELHPTKKQFLDAFRPKSPASLEVLNSSVIMNWTCPLATQGNPALLQQCQTAVQARLAAEDSWKQSQGYLWMQHARKAGGTTLCMTLRLNIYGLVQVRKENHDLPARETCQMTDFCNDCNLKNKHGFSSQLLMQIMDAHQRNFIEAEGNGVPENLWDSGDWEQFVFVSTLRHPVSRIVSLLKNDYCKSRGKDCFEQIKRTFASNVNKWCNKGVYMCPSNYYVRIFSGLDNNYTTDADMIQRAQLNFVRFSCVILLEQWDDTVSCLQNIGLYLHKDNLAFNQNGQMKRAGVHLNTTTQLNSTALSPHQGNSYLTPAQEEQIVSYNQADLIFYEWAKHYLLSNAAASRV